MQNMMKDFSKEMEKMGMQQDMMQDAMDMATDADTDQQADEVYNQILGEIGMGVNQDIKAGTGDLAPAAPVAAAQVSDYLSKYQSTHVSVSIRRMMTCKLDWMHLRDFETIPDFFKSFKNSVINFAWK